jgi:hypothetical protein
MMKNINKYILASGLAIGALFTSCEEEILVPVEDNTEIDALLANINTLQNQLYEYDLEKKTVTISNKEMGSKLDSIQRAWEELNYNISNRETEVQYTVNVISAANYVKGRVAGVGGASVTVRQGDYLETQETAGGLALFKGVKQGEATVTVSAPDHGTVEMSVSFLSDGTYSSNAEYYNAGTQVMLFPVAGKNAATIKGSIYANTTTENDTLYRRYADNQEVFGEKATTWVAPIGQFNYWENFTQSEVQGWDNKVIGNIYFDGVYKTESPLGASVQFEEVPAAFSLYAIAKPSVGHQFDSEFYQQGSYNAGYIRSIIYSDMVFEAAIQDNGSYSVTVPASMGNNLIIEFQTTEVIAEHTRFTALEQKSIGVDEDGDGNVDYYNDYEVMGGAEEIGSVKKTFTYYNSDDYTKELYSFNGDGSVVTINPNSTGEITRRVITETFKYELRGYWMHIESGGEMNFEPGQVQYNNLFLWPVSRTGESDI